VGCGRISTVCDTEKVHARRMAGEWGVEWHDSFIAATREMIEMLKTGGRPRLDGPTGKAVLQLALAAQQSAATGREVRPSDIV
jgi:hypothetical protein